MRATRERYQHGSVRKVPRANGLFAFEFRFYTNGDDGKRRLKVQTFDPAQYPTERHVRKAVEGQLSALNAGTLGGKLAATLGTIMDRYLAEEFPALRHSTQTTNRSLLESHVRPRWGDVRLADVTALGVKQWIDKLPVGPASKARARNMISKLLDLAMLWEYTPTARNPMQLVKVKGSTKRQKKIVVITPAEFRALVDGLATPYSLMVLVAGALGLRVSEVLGLKWADLDLEAHTLTIRQVFTHGQVQDVPKTDASGNEIPVHPRLCAGLAAWKATQPEGTEWIFASPRTGGPYSDATILGKHLKPAARKLGIDGLGWHTFRHSYKAWMAEAKVSPAQMKDLMRHSDIQTTMNVYGRTLTPELRAANTAVAERLL